MRWHLVLTAGLASWFAMSASMRANDFEVPTEFSTIQAAIDAASDGDRIWVAPGEYVENIDFRGKAIDVRATSGLAETIIDGAAQGPVVRFDSGENDARLIGFTLTNGSGDSSYTGVTIGGGVLIVESSPSILECRVVANNAANGAGIYVLGNSSNPSATHPQLESLVVQSNIASSYGGGGVAVKSAWANFVGCRFADNSSAVSGGGAWLHQCYAVFESVEFDGNHALISGGAIELISADLSVVEGVFHFNSSQNGGAVQSSGTSSFEYCTFFENHASLLGGAIYANSVGDIDVERCTFTGNTASQGGAIHKATGGELQMSESIVWANAGVDPVSVLGSATLVPSYSDIEDIDVTLGIGLFDADPMFIDGTIEDLRLSTGSPCIDAGDPMSPPESDGSIADLGAVSTASSTVQVLRGDCNGDASFNLGDVIFALALLFDSGAVTVSCADACDTNDDGFVDLADVIRMLDTMFPTTGSAPSAIPLGECAADATVDGLDCASSSCP